MPSGSPCSNPKRLFQQHDMVNKACRRVTDGRRGARPTVRCVPGARRPLGPAARPRYPRSGQLARPPGAMGQAPPTVVRSCAQTAVPIATNSSRRMPPSSASARAARLTTCSRVRQCAGPVWAGPAPRAAASRPATASTPARWAPASPPPSRRGDVGAVRGERLVHDPVVQAGLAASAAQDESEVTAGFGEQVAAMEGAAAVQHEHRGGHGDGRPGRRRARRRRGPGSRWPRRGPARGGSR